MGAGVAEGSAGRSAPSVAPPCAAPGVPAFLAFSHAQRIRFMPARGARLEVFLVSCSFQTARHGAGLPVLVAGCCRCHGPDSATRAAGTTDPHHRHAGAHAGEPAGGRCHRHSPLRHRAQRRPHAGGAALAAGRPAVRQQRRARQDGVALHPRARIAPHAAAGGRHPRRLGHAGHAVARQPAAGGRGAHRDRARADVLALRQWRLRWRGAGLHAPGHAGFQRQRQGLCRVRPLRAGGCWRRLRQWRGGCRRAAAAHRHARCLGHQPERALRQPQPRPRRLPPERRQPAPGLAARRRLARGAAGAAEHRLVAHRRRPRRRCACRAGQPPARPVGTRQRAAGLEHTPEPDGIHRRLRHPGQRQCVCGARRHPDAQPPGELGKHHRHAAGHGAGAAGTHERARQPPRRAFLGERARHRQPGPGPERQRRRAQLAGQPAPRPQLAVRRHHHGRAGLRLRPHAGLAAGRQLRHQPGAAQLQPAVLSRLRQPEPAARRRQAWRVERALDGRRTPRARRLVRLPLPRLHQQRAAAGEPAQGDDRRRDAQLRRALARSRPGGGLRPRGPTQRHRGQCQLRQAAGAARQAGAAPGRGLAGRRVVGRRHAGSVFAPL